MTKPAFRKEKVWYFPFELSYVENVSSAFDTQKESWAFNGNITVEHNPLRPDQYPNYLYFDRNVSDSYFGKIGDFIGGRPGPFLVIKRRFYDLLQGFDLGATQLIEMPMRRFDQVTVEDEPCWLMNICELKDTLSVEHSDTSPDPQEWRTLKRRRGDHIKGEKFFYTRRMQKEVKPHHAIVLTSDALEGADLWYERKLNGSDGFFTSTRLATAIKEEKIKARRALKKFSVRILK